MIWLLILVLVALAIGLIYFLSRRQAGHGSSATLPARASVPTRAAPNERRFWGKKIVLPDPGQACKRAQALEGRRFAFGHIPSLPLEGCDRTQCACQYEELIDQRSGLERRAGHDRREQIRFEDREERRVGKDRRIGDHYDWRYTA